MRLSELRLSETSHSHDVTPTHGRLRHRVVMLAAAGILLFIGLGFVDFLSRVPPAEEKPSRNAEKNPRGAGTRSTMLGAAARRFSLSPCR